MAVHGEIKRPNTSPSATIAKSITRLCSQTLGLKNHSTAIPTAIGILAASGSHKMEITNMLQQNKKAKINLKTVFNAEMGMEKSTIPMIMITAKK